MAIRILFIFIVLIFTPGQPVSATMESAHFSIDASVISGGGSPMTSAHFKTNATLGQPSPVTPSFSSNFDILPGFWHTLDPGCPWDFLYDGDVDGLDIYEFIQGLPGGYTGTDLSTFCLEFGRTDCPN